MRTLTLAFLVVAAVSVGACEQQMTFTLPDMAGRDMAMSSQDLTMRLDCSGYNDCLNACPAPITQACVQSCQRSASTQAVNDWIAMFRCVLMNCNTDASDADFQMCADTAINMGGACAAEGAACFGP